MILELHLIQNFAPSNLNRSDTGSPKECTFGGFRRARISSQCFKRAMREHFRKNFTHKTKLAERSTRLLEEISNKLVTDVRSKEDAEKVVINALASIEIKMSAKEPAKTENILFFGREEIKEFTTICDEKFDTLLKNPDKNLAKTFKDKLDGGQAADLGLFGRMLAKLPDKNRDASSQVAHAISTHKVGMEFDFFTAVDDLKPEETSGSDHLGTVEFNSACFYRYLNVDVTELQKNLQGDEDLTKATIQAFIKSAIEAIPTGKQNSFATHEKPNFVLAVVRDAGKCSLANAFEKPAKATQSKGLVEDSIEKFAEHWENITGVYGDEAKAKNCIAINSADLKGLKDSQVANVNTLISNTMSQIFGQEA
jgi:CRISPR system Cascade subunit CasC